jgi:hypothetical protein
MYKMIPALIPAVLAASIGSASAQSPSAQGFFSNGPKFAPYFGPSGVFGGGPYYGYGYAYPYGGVYAYPPRGLYNYAPYRGLYNYAYPGAAVYVYEPAY